MTKQQKLLLALTTAAKKQTDVVKRDKILAKIVAIKAREKTFAWLGQ